ncbi:MAG: hypothetical protein WD294_15750 [Phycisphaeraceae bacterium]
MSIGNFSKWLAVLTLAVTVGVWGIGCEQEPADHMEDAGESMQDAAESTGDAVEGAAEEAGDAAEDAGDNLND